MANKTDVSNINLIGSDGKIYSGPVDKAAELVKSGDFRFLTPEEATGASMKDFANTPTEQLKNLGSNYLSTATFGGSDLVTQHTSSPEELEYERIRREENPVGSIAGAGLALATDPFSGLGFAGKGAGKLAKLAGAEKVSENILKGSEAIISAGKFAPTRVVEEGAEALAQSINPLAQNLASKIVNAETSPITHQVLSKIPGRAIRGSTIGGAFAAGQSITEQALGDVDLNGEKIFADGMNGALMGLVFDTSLGALGDVAAGGTKKLYGALKNNEALQNSYSKIISKFAGADEAVVKATIETERKAQAIINSVEKDPSALNDLKSGLHQMFGEGTIASQSEIGNKITEGFGGIYKLISDLYETKFRPLRDKYGSTPVNQVFKSGYLGKMESEVFGNKLFDAVEEGLVKNSSAHEILNKFKPNFLELKTANDIWQLKDTINSELKAKLAGGFYNDFKLNREMGIIADAMNSAQDNALLKAARATGEATEIKLAQDAAKALETERTLYAKDKDKLKNLANSLGIKEPKSFRQFVEKMKDMEGNVLIDKLFKSRNNVKGLEFLRDNYIDQFKSLTDAFKNKIANQSTKNGIFNPVKALDLVSDRNLDPKVRNMIFGEEGSNTIKKAAEAFKGETAENYAKYQARQALLKDEVSDNTFATIGAGIGAVAGGIPGAGIAAGAGAVLDTVTNKSRAARAFLGFEKAFKAFDEKIAKKASEIFEKNPFKSSDMAKTVSTSKIMAERLDRESEKRKEREIDPREMDHELMINNLSEWSENPEKLVEHVANEFGEMDQVAPGMTQAAQATAYRAIDLLKEKLPVMPPRRPLDFTPYVVSSSEAFKFGRYYNTVMNPTGVLNEVSAGTLTNDNLEVLLRVYPSLYKNMQEILMMEMIKYGDKKDKEPLPAWKKLSLSLFLENNLSESLEQRNIGANYNNWLSNEMLSGQQGIGAPQSSSKGNQTGKNIAKSYMTQTQQTENELA